MNSNQVESLFTICTSFIIITIGCIILHITVVEKLNQIEQQISTTNKLLEIEDCQIDESKNLHNLNYGDIYTPIEHYELYEKLENLLYSYNLYEYICNHYSFCYNVILVNTIYLISKKILIFYKNQPHLPLKIYNQLAQLIKLGSQIQFLQIFINVYFSIQILIIILLICGYIYYF